MSEQSTDRNKIAAYRKHAAAARTIERKHRLRRYTGRNSDFTHDVLRGHLLGMERARVDLPRIVQGALTAEHKLAVRLSEARDAKQNRPELRARLVAVRREIRATR